MNSYFVLFAVVFVVGITYGIIIDKYKVFPYGFVKTVYRRYIRRQERGNNDNLWSIGIYEGNTLFDLAARKNISNPVLTAEVVEDIDAVFVADPFMITKNGKYFIFFEVLNRKTNKFDIAYAESEDLAKWNYGKVVIEEKFNLSYPYVFEWNNSYYLIPESSQDFSVRLYKAKEFPAKWEYVTNLLSGYGYADPSIFRYKDIWWLFVSTADNNVLNLYFSNDLFDAWQPHPKNPIVKGNKHFSRPSGRVILYNDKLIRLTQDDDPRYGLQVFAFEITELSETSYSERLASEKPIVTKTGIGWNAGGMHHVDPHKIGDKWIAVVDGRYK